jgi:small subunit ribosomal protein S16
MGKIRTPHFRIVVADSRSARNSKAIEEIGRYSPAQEPSLIIVNSERALYWLGVGATPTPAVEALLKITGDWQKYYDLPGKEGTLKVAPPRPDRRAAFEAAAKDAMNEPKEGATTLKKRAAEKLAAKSAPKAEGAEEIPAAPATEAEEPTTEVAQAAPAAEATESAPESAPASE